MAATLPIGSRLTAGDGAANDNFGYAVALSGTTALVGAPNKTIGVNGAQGAAYVFTFNGTAWVQQPALTANDGAANDQFGTAVALSGNVALVGAPYKTVSSNLRQGAAYVFTFDGSNWVQQPGLVASGGAAFDFFGCSVALYGSTALVGADGKNNSQGAAYVFTFGGSNWVQQAELVASGGAANDSFGYAVALSGTTALIGAPYKSISANGAEGAAYAFMFNGATWVAQPVLSASDHAPNDGFGYAVAVAGTTALVGAPYKTINSHIIQGAAYVLTYNGTTWVQQPEVSASDGAQNDQFGTSVALAGTTALVGAPYKTIVANGNQGAVYAFAFNGTAWIAQPAVTASDGAANDSFGYSGALSAITALAGAPYKTIGLNGGQGAVYVYPATDEIFHDGFDGP